MSLTLLLTLSVNCFASEYCENVIMGREFIDLDVMKQSWFSWKNTRLRQGEERLIPTLVKALKEGRWDKDIFDPQKTFQDSVLRAALEAYKRGLIPLSSYSTLTLRWSAIEQFELGSSNQLVPHKLIENGQATPALSQIFMNLNALQLKSLVHELKKLPTSEQTSWTVSIPNKWLIPKKRNEKPQVWSDAYFVFKDVRPSFQFLWSFNEQVRSKENLYASRETNGLKLKLYGKSQTLLVPSYGMLQAYLNAVSPGGSASAVQMIPKLGITDLKGVLKTMLYGDRIFALSFPEIQNMTNPDDLLMGYFFGSLHDWDHALYSAYIEPKYRKLLVFTALRALDYLTPQQIDDNDFLIKRIADGYNVSSADTWNSAPLPKLIWDDLDGGHEKSFLPLMAKDLRNYPELYEKYTQPLGYTPLELANALTPNQNNSQH